MEKSKTITAVPFKGRTIKEIISAGSKYEILTTNHGHSYEILMNQDIIDVDNYDKSLMAFIKFVEEEIYKAARNYNLDELTQEQEVEIVDFISMILNRITKTITVLNRYGERPTPYDIRACLGQKPKYEDIYIYDIIELIMNENGYMHVIGTSDSIAKIDFVPDNLTQSIDEKIRELNDEPNVSFGSK